MSQETDSATQQISQKNKNLTIVTSPQWREYMRDKVDWDIVQTVTAQSNDMDDADFEYFVGFLPPNLNTLNMLNNKIVNSGLKILMHKDFKQLIVLELNQNLIDSKGIKYLVKANLHNLQRLFLGWDLIGDEGAKHLAKSNWPCFKQTALGLSKIGLCGTINLFGSCWWDKMEILWYKYNLNDKISMLHLLSTKTLVRPIIYYEDEDSSFSRKINQKIKECLKMKYNPA